MTLAAAAVRAGSEHDAGIVILGRGRGGGGGSEAVHAPIASTRWTDGWSTGGGVISALRG